MPTFCIEILQLGRFPYLVEAETLERGLLYLMNGAAVAQVPEPIDLDEDDLMASPETLVNDLERMHDPAVLGDLHPDDFDGVCAIKIVDQPLKPVFERYVLRVVPAEAEQDYWTLCGCFSAKPSPSETVIPLFVSTDISRCFDVYWAITRCEPDESLFEDAYRPKGWKGDA